MIEDTYSGLVDTQVYDLVFKNTPDDALSRNETPKWLNLSTNGQMHRRWVQLYPSGLKKKSTD